MRAGFGYDLHRLVKGRPLILGGVKVDYPMGLSGHSDADVLLHAIIDSLLGAAGLGDIGRHFPPDEAAYKNISSVTLLERTTALIGKKGFKVTNVDSTIVCERPKLTAFMPMMRKKIAEVLGCPAERVNVKAKTEEGLGLTGKGHAVSAYAVALIYKRKGKR
ncbi:MAG: 2-C-methyl-D-erythritol 2,4-cyclodiphosphate synthase [Deltaproteobacteria bacterium]|nr:2-C-methyl-D-erythritol 2,4-cyclodiphosphate synthase [Deltaproteobacteria bacterium]